MPSLLRFLAVIAILAGLVYGAMWALATYVQPEQREMTQPVPLTQPKK
ncbi:histidine kinase [Methylovirgula sp. 4M-Z18]|nr:histidine kinase [Methylovirgula sp. 4M-Z18]RFB78692.1 histidine kinase [Methylovirgula sp. 4M-Z18]